MQSVLCYNLLTLGTAGLLRHRSICPFAVQDPVRAQPTKDSGLNEVALVPVSPKGWMLSFQSLWLQKPFQTHGGLCASSCHWGTLVAPDTCFHSAQEAKEHGMMETKGRAFWAWLHPGQSCSLGKSQHIFEPESPLPSYSYALCAYLLGCFQVPLNKLLGSSQVAQRV